MPATLHIPEGASRGFAVVLHGLGGWREQSVVRAAATASCESGYTTLSFDASDGAVGPDADFPHSTTTGFLNDLEDVVAHAKEEGWCTVSSYILIGHSLGGMVASAYAATHAREVSRLVLIAPAVSWALYTKLFLPYGVWWFLANTHKTPGPEGKILSLRREWLLDFFKHDMRRDQERITVPVLVILGEKDGVVGTEKALRAFTSGFTDSDFVLIPSAGHTFKGHEQNVADTIHTWLMSS